jgi:hypothetical protein
MYNDPTNPYYEDPAYTGGTGDTGDTTTQTDRPYGDPDDNGYWAFIGGVWRWLTEPLGRTTTTGT